MNKVSMDEIKREYRVLKQTLDMHAQLRDRFNLLATTSQMILIVAATVFCATTFAGDYLYNYIGIQPRTAHIILGIFSVLAFCFSIILLLFDWKGTAAMHDDAVRRWSLACEEFRRARSDDDTWPAENLENLSKLYWQTDDSTVDIPNKKFNSLKSQYLKKVEVSKLKSLYPGCPRFLISVLIIMRDSCEAIRNEIRKNRG